MVAGMTALRSRLDKLEARRSSGFIGFLATVPEALSRADADRQVRAGIEAQGRPRTVLCSWYASGASWTTAGPLM